MLRLKNKTAEMVKNIVFIGGIHGVGKSTVCQNICAKGDIKHLSASDLLKWVEINTDPKNKKVKDIEDTQQRLLRGLNETVQMNTNYLLDGHFCLFNKHVEVSRIPISLFRSINPVMLCLVTGNVADIKNNIEQRDNRQYDLDLLTQMQEEEIQHATFIASDLGIKLILGTKQDFKHIQESINDIF